MPCLPEGEEGKSSFIAVSLHNCKIAWSQFRFTRHDNAVWCGLHLACSLQWHTCAKKLRVEQGSVSTPSGPARLKVAELSCTHVNDLLGCSLQITTRLMAPKRVTTAFVPTKQDGKSTQLPLISPVTTTYFFFFFLSLFPSFFLSFSFLRARTCLCVCLCVFLYILLSLRLTDNIFISIFVSDSATDMDGDGGW